MSRNLWRNSTSGIWYVRTSIRGKRLSKSTGEKDETAARKKAKTILAKMQRGKIVLKAPSKKSSKFTFGLIPRFNIVV